VVSNLNVWGWAGLGWVGLEERSLFIRKGIGDRGLDSGNPSPFPSSNFLGGVMRIRRTYSRLAIRINGCRECYTEINEERENLYRNHRSNLKKKSKYTETIYFLE
jgi:hypothetical protein